MMKNFLPQPGFLRRAHPLALPRLILISLCLLALGHNLWQLGQLLNKHRMERQKSPYIFLGNQFLGLNAFLGTATRVGYLTDKNPDERVNAMEFAQAEYVLAPVTLDLNNPEHEYLILAFSSPEKALAHIRAHGLVPLKQNLFGVILARNPQHPTP